MMESLTVLDSSDNQSTDIIGILAGTMIMFGIIIGIAIYCIYRESKKRSSKKPKFSYDNSEGKDTKVKVNPYAPHSNLIFGHNIKKPSYSRVPNTYKSRSE